MTRRRLLGLALTAGLLLAAAGVWLGLHRTRARELPELRRDGIDSAVARAIEEASAAVRGNPESGAAWGRLGMVLQAHDLLTESCACFDEASRWDPREARWPYFAGLALTPTDPQGAVPLLSRAADLAGIAPDAPRLKLAEVLFELGRIRESEEQFRRVLAQEPEHPRATLGLARIAFQEGRNERSLALLLRSERDLRARKASKLLLAQIYLRLGDRASSERERAEAQACDDPGWGDPYLSELRRLQRGVKDLLVRADLLLGKERYAEAVQILEEAARGYPDSVWTWILLARARIKLRDIPPAQDALRRALQLEPSSAEALFRMGVTFTLQEAYADATGWFRKAIAAKPDFARAHFNLGYCLQQLGQRRAAIESFRAAVESEPGNAEAEGLLGHLLTLEGDPGSGAEHLRRALELDPKNAWLRQRLAEAEGRSP